MEILEAKKKLDDNIKKQRTHMYKPIQIAEILYHNRVQEQFDPLDLSIYKNQSKKWRDIVTNRLIGRVSTSSSRFQDDLFNLSAIPPTVIKELCLENNKNEGIVENYIYHNFRNKLANVYTVSKYLQESTIHTFNLADFLELFGSMNGLKKSIDKIYEIMVYSLFYTVIKYLDIQVEMTINNPDSEFVSDFQDFTSMILGIDEKNLHTSTKATIFRVGATNAADRGLDMWSNFGPAIQVKHLTLTPELGEDIVTSISADEIVIVCKKAEKRVIDTLLIQLGNMGIANQIQGIVTEQDLIRWYDICFTKYPSNVGAYLLSCFRKEFRKEFPSSTEIVPFLEERNYIEDKLMGIWKIDDK